jgi:hypothetical protein
MTHASSSSLSFCERKQTCTIARILCGPGQAVVHPGWRRAFSWPPANARGRSAERRILIQSTHCGAGILWRKDARLSALHRGIFLTAPGRAFGCRFVSPPALKPIPFWVALVVQSLGQAATAHRQPSSWQGSLVTPGGAPAPPGCRRSLRLLPAGAAPPLRSMTPHEASLTSGDKGI